MYILPFYKGNIEKLYNYVMVNFIDQKSKGVYSNLKRDSIGFFGHVKLMEAQVSLYKAMKEQIYLDDLKHNLKFCSKHRRENGINNFWSVDFTKDSNWIESNHLAILAYCTYEYWHFTGDNSFNETALQLMNSIPRVENTTGAFIDGYDNDEESLDDRQYLADNSEILLGWWACYKMTGKELYRQRYEQVVEFMEQNFKVVEHQPLYAAWLVGPKHVKYGEGSLEYCDTSHTSYEQFFLSRDVMLMGLEGLYQKVVCSTKWVNEYALFEDGFVGYNEMDDKMVGWTAYFVAQCYWTYMITGENSYYKHSIKATGAVISLQNLHDGSVPPIIPVKGKINWSELDDASEGLGTIWQLNAVLQGLSIIEAFKPSPLGIFKLTTGASQVLKAYFNTNTGSGNILIKLCGSGQKEKYRLYLNDITQYTIRSKVHDCPKVILQYGLDGCHLDLFIEDKDGEIELILERRGF